MKLRILLLLSLFLSCNTAMSNDDSSCLGGNDKERKVTCIDNNSGTSPVSRQDSLVNGFELITGTKNKNISFKYAPKNGAYGFSITATAPLDDDATEANLFDTETNAFANSTTATLNFRRVFSLDVASPQAMKGVSDACTDAPELFQLENKSECMIDIHELVKKLKPEANEGQLGDFVEEIIAQAMDPFYFLGATATYGRKEFEYFEVDSLDTTNVNENPWGVSFYVTRVVPMDYTLTVFIEYQKGYKPGTSLTRCPATTDGSLLIDCKTAIGTAPFENTNKNVKVSLRKKYSLFERPVAIAPEITFDFEDDEYVFGFPLYLFGDGEGQLTGGVRYDFSSDTSNSQYSVFAGAKF